MNKSDRHWFNKEFSRILKGSVDVCGICKENLKLNCRTYRGYSFDHYVVLAGDCCHFKFFLQCYTKEFISVEIVAHS